MQSLAICQRKKKKFRELCYILMSCDLKLANLAFISSKYCDHAISFPKNTFIGFIAAFFWLPSDKISPTLLCTLKCFMHILQLYNNGVESEEKRL